MSTTKSKEELVRLAWITELRRQGQRQCTSGGFSDDVGNVCALGLLREVAGLGLCTDKYHIAASAGLHGCYPDIIVKLNDGIGRRDDGTQYPRHTFSEIADVVEGWFKQSH